MMAVMGPSEALRRLTRRAGANFGGVIRSGPTSIEGRPPIIMVLRRACSAISQAIRQIGRDPPHLHGNFRFRALLCGVKEGATWSLCVVSAGAADAKPRLAPRSMSKAFCAAIMI